MTESDTLHSSRREKLVEHLFVGEVLRHLWRSGIHEVDVLRAETDASGYDIVLEVGSVARHIQLKSSVVGSTTSKQKINIALYGKSSGCVVWIMFDPSTIEIGPFLWFGGEPGHRIPDITKFPIAKHTKANAQGEKTERKNIRVISIGKFERLASVTEVVAKLFGTPSGDAP